MSEFTKEAKKYFNESSFVTSDLLDLESRTIGINTQKLFELMEHYHLKRMSNHLAIINDYKKEADEYVLRGVESSKPISFAYDNCIKVLKK